MATIDPANYQQYATIADRFASYETRRNANVANEALLLSSMKAQRGGAFVVPALDEAAFLKPHATVGEYVEEPNPGPKTGFRPTYFFDLDQATGLVTVTVSGDVVLPAPGSFSYSAVDVDPALPMADFLAAVVTGLGVPVEVAFFVARESTCLGIVGQTGYELNNITVEIA